MDIYIEDYNYITVDEFNNDLQEYQQQKIDHQNTVGVPVPLPKHDIFDKPIGNVLSREQEKLKKQIEEQKEKEKQEKEQQELIEKEQQDEINKCDVNHPDYDYLYARKKAYGLEAEQIEYIVEESLKKGVVKGLESFIEKQRKIKEKYPKND